MNNLRKEYIKYVSLSVISMIGLSCYVFVDTLFISNRLGEVGISSLNIALPVFSILTSIGLMLGMGGATLFALHKKKNENSNIYFTSAFILGLAISIILTIVGALFSVDIARLLGADSSLLDYSSKYIKTILLFSSAFMLNNIMVCFVRNDNGPKLAMAAMLISSLVNVILDYLFIYVFGMGMFGAALASGLGPVASLIVLSIHFFKKNNTFNFKNLAIKLKPAINILKTGFQSFMIELSGGVIILVFNLIIYNIAGNDGIASYGIISNIAIIVISIFSGIQQGSQPLITSLNREEEYKQSKKVVKSSILLGIIFGSLVYLIGIIFSEPLIKMFNSSNENIISMTSYGFKIYFTAFIFMGVGSLISGYFSAIGKPNNSFLISIIRGFIITVPLSFLLSNLLGITGVWLTIPVVELIALLLSIILYTNETKKLA